MADIQSAAAEIRRGKKRKEEERSNHSMKIYMVSLFHRATIIILATPPIGAEFSCLSNVFASLWAEFICAISLGPTGGG